MDVERVARVYHTVFLDTLFPYTTHITDMQGKTIGERKQKHAIGYTGPVHVGCTVPVDSENDSQEQS